MDDTDEVIKAFKMLCKCGIRVTYIETEAEVNSTRSVGPITGPVTTTFKLEGINIKVDSGKLGVALNDMFKANDYEDFIV